MRVDQAIRRVNRDVALVWTLHAGLALAVLAALTVGSAMGVSSVLLAAIPCALWVALAINGFRETRNALQWPALIASGKLDEAQTQIERAIRGFGVLRSVKLLSLHQLAVVKVAQKQYPQAMALSEAILSHRFSRNPSLERASLLLLAGSAVQCGALATAYSALARLRGMVLNLDEQLAQLAAETIYMGKISAWQELMSGVDDKAKLAALMPATAAAEVQAWLALAARRTNNGPWERYLLQRCRLLISPSKLCQDEAAFAELFKLQPDSDPATRV